MSTMRFAALNDQAAFSRGDLIPHGTKAPAAKRRWRCRFCATVQLVTAGLVCCSECRQETIVSEAV